MPNVVTVAQQGFFEPTAILQRGVSAWADRRERAKAREQQQQQFETSFDLTKRQVNQQMEANQFKLDAAREAQAKDTAWAGVGPEAFKPSAEALYHPPDADPEQIGIMVSDYDRDKYQIKWNKPFHLQTDDVKNQAMIMAQELGKTPEEVVSRYNQIRAAMTGNVTPQVPAAPPGMSPKGVQVPLPGGGSATYGVSSPFTMGNIPSVIGADAPQVQPPAMPSTALTSGPAKPPVAAPVVGPPAPVVTPPASAVQLPQPNIKHTPGDIGSLVGNSFNPKTGAVTPIKVSVDPAAVEAEAALSTSVMGEAPAKGYTIKQVTLNSDGDPTFTYEPAAKAQYERLSKAMKDVMSDTTVKNYMKARTQYDFLRRVVAEQEARIAAGESDTGQHDMAIIFTFMKTIDPDSVVREGEFRSAKLTGSAYQNLKTMWESVFKGNMLQPEMRRNFMNAAYMGLVAQASQADDVRKRILNPRGYSGQPFTAPDAPPGIYSEGYNAAPGVSASSPLKFDNEATASAAINAGQVPAGSTIYILNPASGQYEATTFEQKP